MPLRRPTLTLAVFTCLPACADREVSRVEPQQTGEQVTDIPINLSRDIDILFVIDNSISMQEEQDSLRANFPRFVDRLERIDGGLPSLHMAVVSSDVGIGINTSGGCSGDGDNGSFRLGQGDACPNLSGEPYIIDEPDASGAGRNTNYAGTLEEAFSCIAGLGNQGCGFEQHLESMKRSLENPANSGFLRDEAYLAIIVVADEDDCSATDPDTVFDTSQDAIGAELGFFSSYRCWEHGVICNDDNPDTRDMPDDGTASARQNCAPRDDDPYMAKVQDYVDFVKGLKADPGRVVVAGIVGDAAPVQVRRENIDDDAELEHVLMPSCETPGIGKAAPATRLKYFLDQFPNRSVQQSICPESGDLSGALSQIAELLADVAGRPCLRGEPALIDGQPDCRVANIQYKGSDREVETSIPPCALDNSGVCYEIAEDLTACPDTPTHLAIEVDRKGGEAPPETTLVVRCLVH